MQNDYDWIEEIYTAVRMLDMAKNMAPNTKLWAAHLDAAVAELRMERYGYLD